jgi:uroporphyrinogen decarboxylase
MKTLRSIVSDQINHISTIFVPYTLEFKTPVARMLTDHYGSDCWKKQLLQSIHFIGGTFDTWDTFVRQGPENSNIFIDAYGSQWTRTDDISHLAIPALEHIEYSSYVFPNLERFLPPQKWNELVGECETHKNQYPVAQIGAGPFELGWRMMGVQRMLESFICEPEMMFDMIEKLTSLLMSFIHECVKLSVEAIMFGDDWCDQRGCIIGIERWRKFYKPYIKDLFAEIHKSGKKVVLHVCGNVSSLIPDLVEIGIDVLETVQPEPEGMNPYALKKEFGKDITFWGGLGCQSIVTFGNPGQITSEIRKLRNDMSAGGGYILAPSKPINKSVSLENAVAIYETFIEENAKFSGECT